MVLFFRHIPFVVNHTFNATPPERLQQDLYLGKNSKFELLGWLNECRGAVFVVYYECGLQGNQD